MGRSRGDRLVFTVAPGDDPGGTVLAPGYDPGDRLVYTVAPGYRCKFKNSAVSLAGTSTCTKHQLSKNFSLRYF